MPLELGGIGGVRKAPDQGDGPAAGGCPSVDTVDRFWPRASLTTPSQLASPEIHGAAVFCDCPATGLYRGDILLYHYPYKGKTQLLGRLVASAAGAVRSGACTIRILSPLCKVSNDGQNVVFE